MFAGEYLCKVDEKGRFIVPSPIREQIEADGQAVTFLKGPEQSLLIYSLKEWEKVSWADLPFRSSSRRSRLQQPLAQIVCWLYCG